MTGIFLLHLQACQPVPSLEYTPICSGVQQEPTVLISGRFFIACTLRGKSSFLRSFTFIHRFELSLMMQVYSSIISKLGEATVNGLKGCCAGKWKPSIAGGNVFHASKDFALPLNSDAVSHPEETWKKGSALESA